MPAYSDSLQEKLDNNVIVLGGCMIFKDAPKYMCHQCHLKYGSAPVFMKQDVESYQDENYINNIV